MKALAIAALVLAAGCGPMRVVDETGNAPPGYVESVLGATERAAEVSINTSGLTVKIVSAWRVCDRESTFGCFDPNEHVVTVVWQPNCYSGWPTMPTAATIAHELGHVAGHDHYNYRWFGTPDPNDDDFGYIVESVWHECLTGDL